MTITRGTLLVAAAALLAATGCTGGEAAASCSGLVTYDSRDYLPTEKSVFTVGERLGTATVGECDDTPNDAGDGIPESRTGAYRIEGVDPAVGIAVGDSAAEAAPMTAG
ncbi:MULTISPECIES: DUF6281 family protein [unclassified Streptomyces]|uniref:DUF6281 family protein n=1 Tax=unclassified Streptomyces TaxID=2593676 RepID=UPI0022572F5C|nr:MULTISPECIES: DUF6281 family protein [unclassified Streptomyces]MCX5331792.1 DUF6281 family protein [Streptomyces sp. NBC_00140]MCX5361192.1 DUF6281 family protein [Streptomyces sp. NBC_00124]